MALLELLGRRWALRVIWELRAAGVLELGDGGYRLTGEGRRLLEAYHPLHEWADRWAARAARAARPGGTPGA